MSQTTPPVQGQIESPNPLELFWEKNKRIVQLGVIAVAVALAINYAMQYMERRERAERWSAFAEASALDRGYSENAASWPMYSQFLIPQNPVYLGQYLQDAQIQLGANVAEDVRSADSAALETLAEGKDARAPLAIWLLAHRAIGAEDWDAAEQQLLRLQRDHADHFLCRETAFPVQWRKPVEETDENGDPVEPDPNRPPELEAAAPGSQAGRLLAAVQAERAFRAENGHLYTPQEPDSTEIVTLDFADYGQVKIRLFSSKAPAHAAKFLELAREDWWAGQRVHEIRRAPEAGAMAPSAGGELRFGWPSSRADDITQWLAGDVEEEHLVDWEDTDLSHFPGTVAVEPAKEGKSQVEQIIINGEDVAGQADGTRVIIGRVVEGMDVIEQIIALNFADEQAARQGRGRPDDNVTIQAIGVE